LGRVGKVQQLATWVNLGKNVPWIAGLAVILASVSSAGWLAARRGTPLRTIISSSDMQGGLSLGLALVSAGLFFSARSIWEYGLWLAFFLWFAARMVLALQSRRRNIAVQAQLPPTASRRNASDSAAPSRPAARWMASTEPWLVLALTPFLMFPNRATPLLVPLLAIPWLGRTLTQGRLTARTAMDGAILVLVLMLPISVWASTDVQNSMPKLYGIILGMAVFYAIVNHVQRPVRAWWLGLAMALSGVAVSALALLGTQWPPSWLAWPEAYEHVPRLIARMTGGPTGGFNANEVGAALSLYVPFAASLLFLGFFEQRHTVVGGGTEREGVSVARGLGRRLLPVLMAIGLLFMVAMLLLTRSVSAWLGTAAALLLLASFRRRWLWLGLLLVLLGGALALYHLGTEEILNSILVVGAESTVSLRFDIWRRALYMVQDFPYTGVGLNAFSPTANTLYPLLTIPPQRVLQLTHAHNAFLQVAVDVGIPGLIAYLALLIGFFIAWTTAYSGLEQGPLRAISVGLLCGMVAYHVYGLTDCITLGAKPGVVIWAMLGLMAALANLSAAEKKVVVQHLVSGARSGSQ
jgi:putative inorganic carbon (HCO3(-)) transporter